MASYSILTRRDPAARVAAPPSPPPAGATDDTAPDEPNILQLRPAPLADEPPPGLPPLVMRVPEVSGKRKSGESRLASGLYWATVVLGTLLAVALIWTPKKPAQRQMDEAPPWSAGGPSPAQATPATEAPAFQSPSDAAAGAPGEDRVPVEAAPSTPTDPAGAAPSSDGSPTGADTSQPGSNEAPITTARVTGVRYTQPALAGPGEATPLGISTPVAR